MWEFCIGMVLAEYMMNHDEIRLPVPALVITAFVGIGLSALAMFGGSVFRTFNDIPALIGYGSIALFIYYLKFFNNGILFISKFSYEWYLDHYLVFSTVLLIPAKSFATQCVLGFVALMLSILVAWGYSIMFKIGKVKSSLKQ